ncbi:pyroglutamyl-peptidase I [Aetokthonos hydrillicola Thurmond2011]|jgi:pyroglutamyl-peptidase|uniref:Pyrrolidone-carboxylate peptidase n=1 Tax=Aetokthonos hydrillicola Thurmond2011 TaxID=2712845 RepID=A0AAP5M8B2_9CYAN|nr:pyroglutamyl-peptidase I [Aetokthonos hydrillicola]MBO3460500.1 pyroglutamyl-peptidase I [Aetokthonos hydrillicola CCALA 1050]MBW4588212.1 pyroglutamyl-peptidase I [Aetokthonos hydrillicola CCALA 1050]MDR9893104.1 pyroglutamyl-peptidase I [Aetokthonos hydrillicola Thurmond2011]
MKVLLTGFNPFANLKMNPSQLIVEEIAAKAKSWHDIQVTGEVLPTEFVAAGERIQELMSQIKPEVYLGLGVARSRSILNLERVALNLDDCTLPDNAGLTLEGKKIVDDAPVAYFSTLPLLHIKNELIKKGTPVEISNHAGTYVCNHVYYLALRQINLLGIDTIGGFIHIPFISEQDSVAGQHKINLSELVLAIEHCLQILKYFKST